jgi:DNA primase
MIAQTTIDAVMDKMDIKEVVSEFTKIALKKAGVNYVAVCPLPGHNERSGSFVVSPAKGIFKCFGCGKGGNAITFLKEMEAWTYQECIRWLAGLYKIPFEEEITEDEKRDRMVKETIHIVNKYAADTYHRNLADNQAAMEYLASRNISEELRNEFTLGFAPDEPSWLLNKATADHHTPDALHNAGLISDDKTFDKFRNRIIYPIHSLTGKVAGFTGRLLKENKKYPKYLNSAENDAFHKGEILYGMHIAKAYIVKTKNCNLVEGQHDVLTMHANGLKDTVASSGTALTAEQIRIIKRFTDHITILYDGDKAGLKAIAAGIALAIKEGMRIRVVLFPEGDDPDSFIRRSGVEAFNEYVEANKMKIVHFFLKDIDQADGEEKDKIVRATLRVISTINKSETFRREEYLKDMAKILNLEIGFLQSILARFDQQSALKSHKSILEEDTADTIIGSEEKKGTANEREYARLLVRHGDKIHYGEYGIYYYLIENCPPLDSFKEPIVVKIIQEYLVFLNNQVLPTIDDFLKHPDPEIAAFVTDLAFDMFEISHNWEGLEYSCPENFAKEALTGLNYLWIEKLTQEIFSNQQKMDGCKDQEKLLALMKIDKTLKTKRNKYAEALGIAIIS